MLDILTYIILIYGILLLSVFLILGILNFAERIQFSRGKRIENRVQDISNSLDFICEVLAETPIGAEFVSEHPECVVLKGEE